MIFKRIVLTKILNNGMKAEFAIVKDQGTFHAVLYLNGRHIRGPLLPERLNPANGEFTHWMGNRPGVGLTCDEADKIIHEVTLENSVIQHRRDAIE